MARPPGVIDWLVIGAFALLAAVVVYLLQPLVLVIGAVGCLIYMSCTGRRLVRDGGVFCTTASAAKRCCE